MAYLIEELGRNAPRAILDLGPSSTGNVKFWSQFCDQISIQDFFHSAADGRAGTRSSVFRFKADVVETLPDLGDEFDVVLLWDLLHYFEPRHRQRLVEELEPRCRRGALVYLLASAMTPIPMTPISFKVHDPETLDYEVEDGARVETPRITTRDVEQLLDHFEPEQTFQLRNGLQEFILRFRGAPSEEYQPPVDGS